MSLVCLYYYRLHYFNTLYTYSSIKLLYSKYLYYLTLFKLITVICVHNACTSSEDNDGRLENVVINAIANAQFTWRFYIFLVKCACK